VLTHISRRYRERDVLAEARLIFPHVSVARDFDVFQIKRDEFVRLADSGQFNAEQLASS